MMDRLKAHTEEIDEKLKKFAIESDVAARLDKKSSAYDYGTLFKEIADFRLSLGPLIEKSYTLKKFIDQVTKYEINELNEKDFN